MIKKADFLVIIVFAALLSPFFIFEEVYNSYLFFSKDYGLIAAFIKFALLATFGESLGLRIREGVYNKKGFGLLSRAVVWGFLGITIKVAFVVFYNGTISFLEHLGLEDLKIVMKSDLSSTKILTAASISILMNLIYAPIMMTLHKITDTHIVEKGGKISSLTKKIKFSDILQKIDWHTQWHFVFKKTIPFFWIPAHTITFLLPEHHRVLFAAVLGIALGTILAFANLKKK